MNAPLTPAADAAQRLARRRARIADGARLLPFLGVALFLLPDLVLSGAGAEGATASWLGYLFAAWALLIGFAVWIARLQARDGSEADRPAP